MKKLKYKDTSVPKKDIKELLDVLYIQLQKGYISGGCSTTDTKYIIEYNVFKKDELQTKI